MENRELKLLLKEAKLSKKDFGEIFNIPYQTVRNWGTLSPIPGWVKICIQNHIKAKKYDELMKMMSEKNNKII